MLAIGDKLILAPRFLWLNGRNPSTASLVLNWKVVGA
jgi:hypothetical protein